MDNDRNTPATKGDLEDLRGELRTEISMLRSEMHHSVDDLKQTLRDSQTELLKVFYNYAQR
jgi:hypothetical protein